MASMYSDSVRAFLKPIVGLLDDPTVNEVIVNGPTDIWIERGGKLVKTDAQFSEEGLLAAARNVAQFVGRVLSDEKPRLDARLPDGSRIHIVMPPIGRKGTIFAVRKFMQESLSMARLVELGTVSAPLAALLEGVMHMRLNVIVAGGTGSGKTSLLNVLSRYISGGERTVTIEDSAELQLQQDNVIGMESRPADKYGKGEVTLSDLLNSALRLRPDRIVVGEVRGGECMSLLQAMNTGHSGSMATTHANSPTGALRRLETLCLMSSVELPLVAVRAQTASAVHIVVCMERVGDGSRKVTHVTEVLPLSEHGEYRVQDLFVLTQTGRDPVTGAVQFYYAPTGVLPTFLPALVAAGIPLDENFFDPASHGLPQPPIFIAGYGPETKWAPSVRARLAGEPAPPLKRWQPAVEAAPKPAPVVAAPPKSPPPQPAARKSEPVVRVPTPLAVSIREPTPGPGRGNAGHAGNIQVADDLMREITEGDTDPNIRT